MLQDEENAVIVSRTTAYFYIKIDVTQMLDSRKSQIGKQIRIEVKASEKSQAGWEDDLKVIWVTDGEAKQLNATEPGNHEEVE